MPRKYSTPISRCGTRKPDANARCMEHSYLDSGRRNRSKVTARKLAAAANPLTGEKIAMRSRRSRVASTLVNSPWLVRAAPAVAMLLIAPRLAAAQALVTGGVTGTILHDGSVSTTPVGVFGAAAASFGSG